MTFHAFTEFLKYRFYAMSGHGIHSPFVYNFIDEVLKDRSKRTLHEKLRAFFQPDCIDAPEDINNWLAQIQVANNTTVLLFKDIHHTKLHTKKWQQLCKHPSVKMSIDLYQYGVLLLFDEFKEKQHFVLKYPG